jgi:hypothetical protein
MKAQNDPSSPEAAHGSRYGIPVSFSGSTLGRLKLGKVRRTSSCRSCPECVTSDAGRVEPEGCKLATSEPEEAWPTPKVSVC